MRRMPRINYSAIKNIARKAARSTARRAGQGRTFLNRRFLGMKVSTWAMVLAAVYFFMPSLWKKLSETVKGFGTTTKSEKTAGEE